MDVKQHFNQHSLTCTGGTETQRVCGERGGWVEGGGAVEAAAKVRRKYEKSVSTVDPHSPVPWHGNATMYVSDVRLH